MIPQENLQELKIPQPKLSELYSDIILTDEEKEAIIEKALFEARYERQAQLNREAYREKINAPRSSKRYTADDLLTHLKTLPGFVLDDDNTGVVKSLCLYFTDDIRFETQYGFDLTKGIVLFGTVGVGKTVLMSAFRNNQKQSFQVVACQDVESTYARIGDDKKDDTGELGLKKFYNNVPLSATNQYGQNDLGFLFDDLGQENTRTKFYGTERNVMSEILFQRHKNVDFTCTHITTNLSADQIKEAYGIRVADRMREMFNFISFPSTATSRRK